MSLRQIHQKKTNLKRNFFTNKNIKIQSLAYSLNLFLPTLILLFSSFFKDYNLTAELGILIGINIIFTQIFSSNARSIIISKKSVGSIFSYIIFRVIISIFIILANLFFFNFLEFSNNFILFQISIMIIFQWLIELILTFFELKKKIKEFYFYILFAFIFIIALLIDFIYLQNLRQIFFVYNIFLFLFLFISFFKLKKNKINLKSILSYTLTSKAFFSSLAISFANLIWRLFIIYFCGKILAGIYFASFAIGSLPGTLFNNTFGPTMIKNNINFDKNYKFLIICFNIIMFFLLILILRNKDLIFVEFYYTQIFGTFISLIGSVFMIKSQYIRQYIIQKTSHQSRIFKIDIFYSLLVILIVPTLYFIGDEKLIIISFLLSSVVSFLVYNLVSYRKLKSNEFN